MKSSKIVGLVLALAVLSIGVWTVEARVWQNGSWRPGKALGLMGMKAFLELDLTPSQQEEMSDFLSRHEKEREALRSGALQARRKIASVMKTETFDETAFRQAFREASLIREDLMVLRAKMMQELRGVLTSEQKERLARMRSECRERHRDRMLMPGEAEGE